MDERERMDFASNFHRKKAWTENDTEIPEIVMNDGNDRLWSSCALAILKHPDRNRAVAVSDSAIANSHRFGATYGQVENLNDASRVWKLKFPFDGMYWLTYQKVQSSEGSITISL
jgi:hypothetical protein